MVPDKFLPSDKLVDMWRNGLAESVRLSRGQIAAKAVADIPVEALVEEISNTIYSIIIGEFQFMRSGASKVLPLFDEGGLWGAIAKRIDHCLPMCDQEAGQFLKALDRDLQDFFLSGKSWKASWGQVCVADGTINLHVASKRFERFETSRKELINIKL